MHKNDTRSSLRGHWLDGCWSWGNIQTSPTQDDLPNVLKCEHFVFWNYCRRITTSKCHAHKLHIGLNSLDGLHNSIIKDRVRLGCHRVLIVNLVQHFPVRDIKFVARWMKGTIFISESTSGVPTDQACIILRDLATTRISQFSALGGLLACCIWSVGQC